MNKTSPTLPLSLTPILTLGLVCCSRSHSVSHSKKQPIQSSLTQPSAKTEVHAPGRTFEISTNGIAPLRLGMTLDEAQKAFPEAKFERTSDGDGAALIDVLLGKESLVTLFADEEDPDKPIDWSKKIASIESFSSTCATAGGVRVGTLVSDAEKVFGKTKIIVQSEIESREYIKFQRHPKHLYFRIDYTGIFPEGSRETTKFNPQAKIFSISVSKS